MDFRTRFHARGRGGGDARVNRIGIGQGIASRAALEGVARNPQASGKILVPLILGLALIESLVIYALIIAFQLIPG